MDVVFWRRGISPSACSGNTCALRRTVHLAANPRDTAKSFLAIGENGAMVRIGGGTAEEDPVPARRDHVTTLTSDH